MQTKAQEILAGSLNHLPPADLIPDQDAIALENWRVDQEGALRARKGHSAAVFTGIAGRYVRRIVPVDATPARRYYSCPPYLYRDTTQITALMDLHPPGVVSMNGFAWLMNQALQIKDDGTNTWAWTPAAPAAAPTQSTAGSGQLNGDVSYWVTFDTAAGHETNPSPVLELTALVDATITITRPAASSDPQITAWNLYRQDGFLPEPYKVNPTPIPIATTTFVDDGSDPDHSADALAGRGEALDFDHDPAPAARGCCAYMGRILAWNTVLHSNRLYWTVTGKPWYFPGSADEIEGSWTPVGEDGEAIVAVAVFPRMVIILKERSIHRLVGDPEEASSDIERINADVGLIGEMAWCYGAGTVYFQTAEGVARLSSDRALKVSLKLDPVFKGDISSWAGVKPALPINPTFAVRALSSMEYVNGRLFFSYADSEHSTPNTTLVFDEVSNRWYSDSRGFDALCYEGQGGAFLGARATLVCALETGATDDGASIPLIYQTRYFNQGAPDNLKTYADLVVDHNTAGRTFTVKAYLDTGELIVTLGTLVSTVWTATPFRFEAGEGLTGKNVSIRLSCEDDGTGEAQIFKIILHYYVHPREGLTWDSGKVNLGSLKVKEMDTLAFDVEAPAGAAFTWKLYSDLPGEEFIRRDSGTVSAGSSGTLHRLTCPLNSVKGGVWVRVLLTCAQPFQMRGASVHGRAIGLYLAGAEDHYRSDKITLGSARLKLCREMRVYCDTDGAVTGTFLSDMPFERLLAAATGSMDTSVTTPGARWMRLRFPGETRARAAAIELVASEPARIYEIQVRVKILGEGITGWQWVSVPIEPTPSGFAWIPIQETP
jgi:hypothetical protein